MKNVFGLSRRSLGRLSLLAALLIPLVSGALIDPCAAASTVSDKVVVDTLERPWAVVAGPDGNIWISELGGQIKIFSPTFTLVKTLTNFPDLEPNGQGGLMDIAFHPNFAANGWIYISYTVGIANSHTRVNRFKYANGQLTEHKVLFDGPPGEDGAHFGGRLMFDSKGYLYASFGERHHKELAQSLTEPNGKVIRLTDDGAIPADNPFGPNNAVFTLGHRNPQGLAMHPVSLKLYDSEHGPTGYDAPMGGDEINELVAGSNYGWPLYHHQMTAPGFVSPLLEYTPAIAPSGIAFYTGAVIPQWKNDLFVATLAGGHLLRVRFDAAGKVVETEKLLNQKYGRLRDVGTSPDGTLLVVSDGGELIQLK